MTMIFPVFLGIVVALFFLLPVKGRPALLLFSSYFICGFLDLRALVVLVLFSLCTWRAGIRMEVFREKGRERTARFFVVFMTGFYVGLLCIYKYGAGLVSWAGWQVPQGIIVNLIMPVGFSFYLFQGIGYLADIYWKKTGAEKNFWHIGCVFAFFPKLVSGPIENAREFLPQIRNLNQVRFGDRGRWSTAFTYMLWGYFMKMVAADRLAVTVNKIFGAPEAFDSAFLIGGAILYTIQIYCDFAGYSYIAVGCAEIFGIELTQNFKAPYCATSITDFWRRWHISLSAWLRDYLYIPLGGNRKGIFRKYVNTMIVFLVCGMWHGAGIHFVVWGLLHGLYSVVDTACRRAGWKIRGGRVITFLEVAFAWIFFRAENMGEAVSYVGRMFSVGISPGSWRESVRTLGLSRVEIAVIAVSILSIWLADEFCNGKKLHLPVLVQQKENAARYFIFYLLIITIFIFGMYGPGYHAEQFIYMQF